MSRKRTVYSSAFKSRLVLEVLKNEKTLSEIASAHNITPMDTYHQSILDQKKLKKAA